MTNTGVLKRSPFKNSIHRFLFYCEIALMIAAIFARNVLDISVPVIMILAIGAFVALCSTREEIIALVIACIPMSAAFQYKYLIIICIVLYAVKFYKDIKFSPAVLPLLFMVAWELVHGIFYPFSLYECLRGFTEIIFCTFLMLIVPKRFDYKLICRLLAVASICMMVVVLLNLLEQTNYNFEEIFTGTYRFGVGDAETEQYGVNYNANTLGLIANLSIAGLLQLIASKKHNVFDYLMIGVLAMFGVMTMSRAFLVCFILIIVMFSMAGVSSFVGKLKRILLIAVIVSLLVVIVITLMPTVYESYVERFRVDDISNGRNDLFVHYTNHILSSPKYLLFGVGTQDYMTIINDIHHTDMLTCHNATQELVICWGLPGLALFVWFVIEMVRNGTEKNKRNITNYIPLILVLVYVQSIQLITSGMALLCLAFSYTGLCCDLNPPPKRRISNNKLKGIL